MTIIAVVKTKALRTGPNAFIITLSTFDLIFATVVIPTILSTIWNNAWVFNHIYCSVYAMVTFLTVGGNLASLSGTALSRYLKIIHPHRASVLFARNLNIGIFVCCLLSVPILLVLPAVTGIWGKLGYNPNTIICHIINDNSGYTTFMMTCCIVIPILFISLSYLRIFCKVCSNRRKIQAARNGDGNQQPVAVREDLRFTKMMVTIFIAFLLTYVPYLIDSIVVDSSAVHNMTRRFLTLVCLWLSSCVNPILYGLLNRNFRQAFINIYAQIAKSTNIF